MKPLIGITMNLEERPARSLNILDQDYGKAVLHAGGIPVPVLGIKQSIPEIMRQLDGFLFTGGDDIHPRRYHERPLAGAKLTLTSDNRVKFEIELFKAAVKARKPVLAVCYGAQLVAQQLGGTVERTGSGEYGRTELRRTDRSAVLFEGLPVEQDWDSAKYLRHTPQLFEAVREAIGWEHELLHDVHHRLTPIEAARLGRDLADYAAVVDGGQ